MTNSVLLDKNTHKYTRIKTERGAQYGEAINYIPVVADELSQLALDYPVYFMKNNQTGQFELFALTGFDEGQNLFLQKDIWQATYVPLHIQRQPFKLGVGNRLSNNSEQTQLAVTINEQHPRVSNSEGVQLFDENSEPTAYLTNVSEQLIKLMNGGERTTAFINTLLKHDLIEAVQLNITQPNGKTQGYNGLYSIAADTLQQLSAETLNVLHSMGYIQACHLIICSSGHVQKLVKWLHDLK
ncbi:SapC family protein [Pseudoalteromonas sp. NZS127_1]|uniref:SapC family protein n=1 Tax=unclassified Pseudoalteromonas TaxID=194690 RepID=UPI00140E4706|nr:MULTISPECIES: SapC family protein [unclassified Pseudoalteromonas]MBG9993899.1 SapC family protein [Pseudoalteromonas sp. NZS127_1]MBH0037785.1 SapC family protein [Pseudoalteromonas sp. SWN166]MBH0041400.1 SapC family protein [Pseudoalteromonas sp. SWXJZ10B]